MRAGRSRSPGQLWRSTMRRSRRRQVRSARAIAARSRRMSCSPVARRRTTRRPEAILRIRARDDQLGLCLAQGWRRAHLWGSAFPLSRSIGPTRAPTETLLAAPSTRDHRRAASKMKTTSRSVRDLLLLRCVGRKAPAPGEIISGSRAIWARHAGTLSIREDDRRTISSRSRLCWPCARQAGHDQLSRIGYAAVCADAWSNQPLMQGPYRGRGIHCVVVCAGDPFQYSKIIAGA